MKQIRDSRGHSRPQPWGLAIGLLAGCIIAIIGIAVGVRPETVLVRASIGASIVAVAVSLVVRVVGIILTEDD